MPTEPVSPIDLDIPFWQDLLVVAFILGVVIVVGALFYLAL